MKKGKKEKEKRGEEGEKERGEREGEKRGFNGAPQSQLQLNQSLQWLHEIKKQKLES